MRKERELEKTQGTPNEPRSNRISWSYDAGYYRYKVHSISKQETIYTVVQRSDYQEWNLVRSRVIYAFQKSGCKTVNKVFNKANNMYATSMNS